MKATLMKLNPVKDKSKKQRRPYHAPLLKKYGTVTTITRADSGTDLDGFGGYISS